MRGAPWPPQNKAATPIWQRPQFTPGNYGRRNRKKTEKTLLMKRLREGSPGQNPARLFIDNPPLSRRSERSTRHPKRKAKPDGYLTTLLTTLIGVNRLVRHSRVRAPTERSSANNCGLPNLTADRRESGVPGFSLLPLLSPIQNASKLPESLCRTIKVTDSRWEGRPAANPTSKSPAMLECKRRSGCSVHLLVRRSAHGCDSARPLTEQGALPT